MESYGDSVKELTRRIFTLQKRSVKYIAGLKQRESCGNTFRQLNILTVYSLYIQETILYAKGRCNCSFKKPVHTYNARNNDYHRYVQYLELYNTKSAAGCTDNARNNDYHRYVQYLELYNSKSAARGCIFYNKLPNIEQIGNKASLKRS
jgi:hypothetical protein